jgi:anti-sigma B factor antagonist
MEQSDPLLLTQQNNVTIVAFAQPNLLDAYHIADTSRHLLALVEKQRRRLLVLDLSNIRMISSQSLGTLLTLKQKLEPLQGRLAIAGIDPKLSRVFKITKLHQTFPFCPDVPAAINAILNPPPSNPEA